MHPESGKTLSLRFNNAPWDTMQLDQAFFDTAQRQGCPVEAWAAQHQQLSARMRKARTL